MIPTLVGIVLISFLVIRQAPGDPASIKHGNLGATTAGMNAERGTEDAIVKFRKKYGFDKPLPQQFGMFLKRMFWDFEPIRFQNEKPIWDEMWRKMKVTMALNAVVFVLIYVIAVPLGIYSAAAPRSLVDRTSTVALFMLYSLPSFWAAELLRGQHRPRVGVAPRHAEGRRRVCGLASLLRCRRDSQRRPASASAVAPAVNRAGPGRHGARAAPATARRR